MANNINYVPQVDYTSRDYVAIRDDLINLIDLYAPTWTSRDPADLGIALIELFAYMGDSLNFYIDRAANEGFIGTASQRDSILQIASMLGYLPNKLTSATVELTLTNSDSSAASIPAGTLFSTSAVINGLSTQIFFESSSDVVVPAKVGSTAGVAKVTAVEGATVEDESLGYSSGAPRQVFKLAYPYVIESSVSVTVNNVAYRYVPSLLDYGMSDFVFSTFNDSSKNTYVVFGDGINGSVPAASGQIVATYRVGTGANGNVPANSITAQLTNLTGLVSVTNDLAATGGADEESTDSIRVTAPKALRSLTRAVSLKDYASLALQVSGVAKAVTTSSSLNSVVLYVAPAGDSGTGDGTVTSSFVELANKVATYFMDKTLPNTALTILPPTYVPIDLQVSVNLLPQYKQTVVVSNLLTLFRKLVSVNNSFFADVIPIQYFMKAATSVQGIDYITVDVLKKASKFNVSLWNRVSSGNVVTLVTTAAHGITVGQTFKALPVTPLGTNTSATLSGTSVYNPGTWTSTAVTTNSITFTNSASTGTTSGTAITINTSTPTYSAPNVSITTASAHGLSVGQQVLVSGITPAGYNGVWTTATGTTGSTLVLPIGSNPGAITVAGFVAAANFVVGTQTPTGTTNISITTSSTHNIVEKQQVVIAGVVPTGYNGTWTAQSGTSGTTLVLNIGSNPGAITTAGTAAPVVGTVDLWQGLGTVSCAVNEIPSEGTFVAVPTGGIS